MQKFFVRSTAPTTGTAENGVVIELTNQKVYTLPSTGGSGIYWYMIGGMVLMSTAAWILYKNKCREKQILLYVSNNENTEDAEVIALVQELFLPLGYELDIFWEKHFAVIGQEQTMQLDEIKLL